MSVNISVAMATCNGAKYLKEQLKSLNEQSSPPFELVVCDDCSDDDTWEYLVDFASRASFPVRVFRNERRLGFADNFFKAARLCTGDWIAFCDQDDIWLSGKLASAQRLILNNDRATLVLQNSYLCDSDLSHDRRIFPNTRAPGFYPPGSLYGFWVWPGFLQIVNAAFFRDVSETLPRPRSYYPDHDIITHDKWTCMLANARGGVIIHDEPVALYRRHETAVTGNYVAQGFQQRIAKSFNVGRDHYGFLSLVALESAAYLRNICQASKTVSMDDFTLAAEGFERLSLIQLYRSTIYSTADISARLNALFRVFKLGGYFGPAMVSMGWKSAGKDALASLGFFNRQHQP